MANGPAARDDAGRDNATQAQAPSQRSIPTKAYAKLPLPLPHRRKRTPARIWRLWLARSFRQALAFAVRAGYGGGPPPALDRNARLCRRSAHRRRSRPADRGADHGDARGAGRPAGGRQDHASSAGAARRGVRARRQNPGAGAASARRARRRRADGGDAWTSASARRSACGSACKAWCPRETRIEVVTEGVFARMIVDDPELRGVAAVLFDEFHERSLDADLGLALALDAQGGLREDLRLLVMSATLDGARVARLMQGAAEIESARTRLSGRDPLSRPRPGGAHRGRDRPGDARRARRGSAGRFSCSCRARARSCAWRRLSASACATAERRNRPALRRARRARAGSRRRPGAARAPQDRARHLDRRDLADHRGRARGHRFRAHARAPLRAGPGPDAARNGARLARQRRPAPWPRWPCRARASATGSGRRRRTAVSRRSRRQKSWPPTSPASRSISRCGASTNPRDCRSSIRRRARRSRRRARLLVGLGALDADGRVTEEGRAMREAGAPAATARMLVDAAREGDAAQAAEDRHAAERARTRRRRASISASGSRRFAATAPAARGGRAAARAQPGAAGVARLGADRRLPQGGSGHARRCWLARAFPDRIARARGKRGEFLMANGRAASVEPHDPLAGETFLAVGEIAGRAGAARILLAAPLTRGRGRALGGEAIETVDELTFDRAAAALRRAPPPPPRRADARRADPARRRRRGRGARPGARRAGAWARTPALDEGAAAMARPRRCSCAAPSPARWPDLSDAALAAAPDWLAPYLVARPRSPTSAPTISPPR